MRYYVRMNFKCIYSFHFNWGFEYETLLPSIWKYTENKLALRNRTLSFSQAFSALHMSLRNN